ncbi:acid phosphatase [Gordonia sp. CPCC 205333]|uniref:acid phosphatase n=1 Tax=Gordonia sp. CPCC 205333 TaxID=3140790 RepID=UPI003AF379B3
MKVIGNSLKAVAAAMIVAGGLLVPGQALAAPSACAFAPTSAPTSAGYSASQKASPFATKAPADHIGVLDGFSQISDVVRQQNLANAVAINVTSAPTVAQYAVNDNYDIEGPAIFNALGSKLSPAFYAALRAGQLPKTAALLLGEDALVGERVGTAKEKKYFHNLRPFEVAPQLIRHYGDGRADLYEAVRGTGSYPSGHTTWGFTQAFLIASMLPEVGPQLLARGAEYGYHRVVLGVHYPLDVIGGRMQAESTVAQVLSDPNFAGLLGEAKTELRAVLTARTGAPLARVVACQSPYQSTGDALKTYRERATYSFVAQGNTSRALTVPAGAENLIRAAHPNLSTTQLRQLLARTALPAGYPLDKTGRDGGWQRLDIAKAWLAR